MILTGMAGIIVIEIYTAVMLRFFENTNNKVGKGFAILGIYLFVVCYSKRFLALGKRKVLTHGNRWAAQQHDMAVRRRGPADRPEKQSHGSRRRVSLHRQRRWYVSCDNSNKNSSLRF